MADNIVVKTDPGNIKVDKEKSTEKIDGIVALIMGLARVTVNPTGDGSSIYDERDMIILGQICIHALIVFDLSMKAKISIHFCGAFLIFQS